MSIDLNEYRNDNCSYQEEELEALTDVCFFANDTCNPTQVKTIKLHVLSNTRVIRS